jgi:putative GTP pyrophosphokinase
MNHDYPENLMRTLATQAPYAHAVMDENKNLMWTMVKYKELRMIYSCALKEVQTKFDVLSTEFNLKNKRNPISSVSTRLKSSKSIMEKMMRKHLDVNLTSMEQEINDIAGIRVICSYIDDIYMIADALLRQDDVTLIARKDYIKNPKENGYRSLHLIISIPVFFADQKRDTKVEVQIRTIAMDFWASLEHQIKYKHEIPDQEVVSAQLKECADVITATDEKMLSLRKRIELAQDIPDEEDELLLRLQKIDTNV